MTAPPGLVELSAAEVPGALALRDELEPQKVVFMETVGTRPRVFVPERLVADVRVRIAPERIGPRGKDRAAKAGGSPDALYPREEIARALRGWRNRNDSPQQVSQASLARAEFSRTAVRRVIRLDEHGAFDLGQRGGLRLHGTNGEFRAAPKKVSLRALERALGLPPLA